MALRGLPFAAHSDLLPCTQTTQRLPLSHLGPTCFVICDFIPPCYLTFLRCKSGLSTRGLPLEDGLGVAMPHCSFGDNRRLRNPSVKNRLAGWSRLESGRGGPEQSLRGPLPAFPSRPFILRMWREPGPHTVASGSRNWSFGKTTFQEPSRRPFDLVTLLEE